MYQCLSESTLGYLEYERLVYKASFCSLPFLTSDSSYFPTELGLDTSKHNTPNFRIKNKEAAISSGLM